MTAKRFASLPDQSKSNLLRHYANLKMGWNRKEFGLSKSRINELIGFQRAIAACGITNEQFLAHADRRQQ